MTNIKLVTDSSVQLTPEEIAQYNITVVPLQLNIDGKTYVDGKDIDRMEFVDKMLAAENLPTTSQPSIGTFVDTFTELTADGSKVLAITMTEGLSGTVNAARQAAEMVEGADITVVDSHFIDRALAEQLIVAAKDIEAGKDIPEILEDIKDVRDKTFLRLVVVNLDNIIKGGRLGKLTGRIATALNIKAILKLDDGKLVIDQKGRGQKTINKVKAEILDRIKEADDVVEVGISHVAVQEEMEEFAAQIHEIKPDLPVIVRQTSPIVTTHTGVGAFAVMFYTK